jgi:hypothetical protein
VCVGEGGGGRTAQACIFLLLQQRRCATPSLPTAVSISAIGAFTASHMCCFCTATAPRQVYLNLVLEYVPDTVYRINKHYTKNEQRMPIILVKLYTYQMLRALAHIHSIGVCHRRVEAAGLARWRPSRFPASASCPSCTGS